MGRHYYKFNFPGVRSFPKDRDPFDVAGQKSSSSRKGQSPLDTSKRNSCGSGETLLTGIRAIPDHNRHDRDWSKARGSDAVYISGVYRPPQSDHPIGLIYQGELSGKHGKWHVLNFPSSHHAKVTGTTLYGPNAGLECGADLPEHSSKFLPTIQVVGNYTTKETGDSALGCLYQGPVDGSGKWTTLCPPSSKPVLNTIAHSTMET